MAELTASDGTNGEALGASVAISGSTVVAGAPNRQVTHLFQGAAYVFVESGGTWSQQAELTSPDGEELDYFGSSVAVSGSTAVVGAMDHPFGALLYPGQGAAYVFVENGGTWSQEAELTSSDGATEDSFGQSVAINGNTLVAGAPGHAVGSSGNQGAAYVFGSSGPLYTLSAFPTSLSVGQGEQETGPSASGTNRTFLPISRDLRQPGGNRRLHLPRTRRGALERCPTHPMCICVTASSTSRNKASSGLIILHFATLFRWSAGRLCET